MDIYVITGASRGIGRATASRLAAKDRKLILHGRDTTALKETAALVENRGAKAELISADLSTATGIETLAAGITGEHIHALINNAAVSIVKPFEETTHEEWEKTVAVNIMAPVLLTRKLLPRMVSGSAVVNVLSVANQATFPQWTTYTMSKHALEGFSKVLREELRPKGIRVVDVYPAATATDLWDDVPGDWNREGMLQPDEVAEAIAYTLERPSSVLVDSISVGNLGGNL